jgi:hypothetical protein
VRVSVKREGEVHVKVLAERPIVHFFFLSFFFNFEIQFFRIGFSIKIINKYIFKYSNKKIT